VSPYFCSILTKFEFIYNFQFIISNFTEILPVGAAVIHAEGEIHALMVMTQLTGAFCDNAHVPKTIVKELNVTEAS
jgi:hypothetical protein